MTTVRYVRWLAAIAAVALAIGCSKDSTGPSDPFVGSWNVTLPRLVCFCEQPPDTGTISPVPFTLTIAKSGYSYSATFPALTLDLTAFRIRSQIPTPASDSVQLTISLSGDTLTVRAPYGIWGQGCNLAIIGAFQGGSAQGKVDILDGSCGSASAPWVSGPWTATKQ